MFVQEPVLQSVSTTVGMLYCSPQGQFCNRDVDAQLRGLPAPCLPLASALAPRPEGIAQSLTTWSPGISNGLVVSSTRHPSLLHFVLL